MYAFSNEIMTLTSKIKVSKKHAKNANISETGIDTHTWLQLFIDMNL